jgi:hypothetical protein
MTQPPFPVIVGLAPTIQTLAEKVLVPRLAGRDDTGEGWGGDEIAAIVYQGTSPGRGMFLCLLRRIIN